MARTYGKVTLSSESPRISVTGVLTKPVDSPLPRPKYDSVERYGFFDLPKYAGQQPYELTLQMRLKKAGHSVEREIRSLERLAERPEGRDAPPEVTVDGPVPHSTLRWRITQLAEDNDRTRYDQRDDRTEFVVTVTLEQRVTDTLLSASLNTSNSGKGIGNTTTVRAGEQDLYDVAQRYYHDSSLAIAISKANPVKGDPMRLGTHLKTGQKLRMP